MIQETSNLAFTMHLTQESPHLLEKGHDIDDHPVIWFSSIRL